jgi:hypothetical protein
MKINWEDFRVSTPKSLRTLKEEKMTLSKIQSQLQELAAAVKDFQRGLETLAVSQNSAPVEPIPVPAHIARKYPYLPTDWPVVGGRGANLAVPDIFDSDAYRDAYRGGPKREIYVAASAGLGRVAKSLNMPIYKVSTCAENRMPDRMAELRADAYASTWFCGGRYVSDADYDDWFPSHFRVTRPPLRKSPVTAAPRAITVTLPDSMTPAQFDHEFDEAVRAAAIDEWVMSREGRDHCFFRGVEPAFAIRMTPYRHGGAARNSPARELACFRPKQDGNRLVAIAEIIILKHLGLIPGIRGIDVDPACRTPALSRLFH